MKKIFLWFKKHIKCWHEGHDYYHQEIANGGFFICKRCGKVTEKPIWGKE